MSTKVREILDRVAKRVGGAEWFIILLPILEQLFAALLEQCTNTEEEAVDMLTDPTALQATLMQRRVARSLRREGSVPRRQRRARAWQIVYSVVEEARADPDTVAAAFKEVSR